MCKGHSLAKGGTAFRENESVEGAWIGKTGKAGGDLRVDDVGSLASDGARNVFEIDAAGMNELHHRLIGEHLPDLLDRLNPQIVLYNAGVDPHREDRLGRLALTDVGLLQRDHLVLDACLRRHIPVATVIGGGYDAMTPLVKRHSLVFRAAADQARLHGL